MTTFWVHDVPHCITHQNLAALIEFTKNGPAGDFRLQVERFMKIPAMLELSTLVVTLTYQQRESVFPHGVTGPKKGTPCDVKGYDKEVAYIEDGSHRTVAKLLGADQCDEMEVVTYDAEGVTARVASALSK